MRPAAAVAALAALIIGLPAWAGELKLATWNLNWLTTRPPGDAALPGNVVPRQPGDLELLRGYADRLDADVVAFQEVDGPGAAARVFPPERYDLAITGDAVVQRVGFAVRRGLRWTRNPDLAALDVVPNARFRLRSGADITLDLPGGRLRLLAVHLKSGCHRQPLHSPSRACSELSDQVAPLQGWIAQRRAEGVPFVLLGDFNRTMDGRDELAAALSSTGPLLRATAGHASPCRGGGSFIDHILAGGAARGWMQPDTLRVMLYQESGRDWESRLSDHCPVSVRFLLPPG